MAGLKRQCEAAMAQQRRPRSTSAMHAAVDAAEYLGSVASGHELTSLAAEMVLRRGGNAYDAIVAGGFAASMAEPAFSSLAGGGFLLARAPGGEARLFDFFVDAPGKGLPAEELAAGKPLTEITVTFPGAAQAFHIGAASAAVPGVLAGLLHVHAALGRLPLAAVAAPALRFAEEGVRVRQLHAHALHLLAPIFAHSQAAHALFLPGGRAPDVGETWRNAPYAAFLRGLCAGEAWASFHTEEGAARTAAALAGHSLLTARDLREYRVLERRPLEARYRGHRVLTNPGPSLGGGFLRHALGLLAAAPAAPWGSAAHVCGLARAMRQAEDARADPPPQAAAAHDAAQALSHELAHQHEAHQEAQHEAQEEAQGKQVEQQEQQEQQEQVEVEAEAEVEMEGDGQSGEAQAAAAAAAEAAAVEEEEAAAAAGGVRRTFQRGTTHMSVVDAEGNVAAMTTSNGEGAGVLAAGAGVMLNNMLGEDDLHPAGVGVAAPPGLRVCSSMAPTLVLDEAGDARLVVGSAGSKRIRTALLQVITNVLDHGMTLRQAVDAPRIHWDGAVLQVEPGLPAAALAALQQHYEVNVWREKNLYFGGCNAANRTEAVGDSRRDCAGAVYHRRPTATATAAPAQ